MMPSPFLPAGCLMVDLQGAHLQPHERNYLKHPLVGGVLLFSRNTTGIEQLYQLIAEIRDAAPDILIAVDQEGGRVQRFKDGFTRLPPPGLLGSEFDRNPDQALAWARHFGWLLGAELRNLGVDLSFTPVLDLGGVNESVIGNRALHADPGVVASLAIAMAHGLRRGGLPVIGKHFPGHGSVIEDSHLCLPEDHSSWDFLWERSMAPYRSLIMENILDGVMTAHVRYTTVNDEIASFSSFWLREILRDRLGFEGIIFSDDLHMKGAETVGTFHDRILSVIGAGCDVAILSGCSAQILWILEQLTPYMDARQNLNPRLHLLRKPLILPAPPKDDAFYDWLAQQASPDPHAKIGAG